MNSNHSSREEGILCIVALLVACVLAANQVTEGGLVGWLSSYAYWCTRIAIESALFFMVLLAVEKYTTARLSEVWSFMLAYFVSLIPFVLAITSFDLIVGLPELGLNGESDGQAAANLSAFGRELIYLSDNHLSLCAILYLSRLLLRKQAEGNDQPSTKPVVDATRIPSFLDAIDPPLNGRISWVEAQEHYVKITTQNESRMVLHRFADAVRELPAATGMQVHRSHWVSFADIKALKREGQKLRLLLSTGDYVPVSRSYRQLVEEKFQSLSGKQSV